jgi:hypothetical protein
MTELMFDEPMAPLTKQGDEDAFDSPKDHALFFDAQHEPSAAKLFKF